MGQNDEKFNKFDENDNIIPRVAVIQDMSGFGKVSLTEAIPVISAMGVEVCPLPTAILSTHTYEFKNYTLCDMTDEMEKIIEHWQNIGLKFDAVYSGYMSSARQVEITKDFMLKCRADGAKIVVDPVMGDNALIDVKMVYSERMNELIGGMRELCSIADAVTPNLTEVCLLTGVDYPKGILSDSEIKDFLKSLMALGAKNAVITSIMDGEGSMCVAVCDGSDFYKIDCGYVKRAFHGTGDIFTSVFTGALVNGKSVAESANIATDFVYESIKNTIEHPQIPIRHGVLFELVLKSGYFAKDSYPDRIKLIKG